MHNKMVIMWSGLYANMLLTMLKHFVRIFVRCWGQATVSHDIIHSVDYANPGTKAIMYSWVISYFQEILK